MSYTFHSENQAWLDAPKGEPQEVDEDFVPDPTAQSGTLDTSGTTGTAQSAADVSEVFAVADQASAANPVPEETLEAPAADPAATGDDALVPDYTEPEPSVGEENKFDGRKDPGDYTVKEVKAYLDGATEKQKESVKAKEAKGQNRAGIMNA